MNNYEDIIKLTRPKSKHPHLGIDSRAAQFAPFAALTGYDSAVRETARLTKKKIELCDELKEVINTKLNYIENNIKDKNIITVTYFIKDEKKDGGRYESYSGIVKRVNNVEKFIKFEDNKLIEFEDILSLDGDVFNEFNFE
jgi:hypothetical protein